jgi:hypothetical protein
MPLEYRTYLKDRGRFTVTREQAIQALAGVQQPAIEALGVQAVRHVLWEGQLPAHIVMSSAEEAGWGELMPMWFHPSDRPVPLFCLDHWALFAGLYRTAFGEGVDDRSFTVESLLRVMTGSSLLIPFLPGTQGTGRFLQNGALTVLLGILWLDQPARDGWLEFHASGARRLAADLPAFADPAELDGWLWEMESNAFLVPERGKVAGEEDVRAFLADPVRSADYQRLFECLCLSVTALHAQYGSDWRSWIFQTLNVQYPIAGFGLDAIAAWLERSKQK